MKTFAFHWHRQSALGEASCHSLLIALLRGLAALQVAAAHLRAEIYPSLRTLDDPPLWFQGFAFFTGFAHQAVIVFFVLSGWLVGGSLLSKFGQPQAIASYAIDRTTRLWTVLLPTFIVMLALGVGTDTLDAHRVDFSAANNYSLTSFLGNLVGLQTVAVPNFGGNYALWSLCNETWYYVLFPLLMVAFCGRSASPRVAATVAIVLIAGSLPWPVTLYFALWLLGVAFSRVRIEMGTGWRVLLVGAIVAIGSYYRLFGINDDLVAAAFGQDLLCSLPFLLLLSSLQDRPLPAKRLMPAMKKISEQLSDFSFTLYVTHVPLIAAMRYAARTVFGSDKLTPTVPAHFAVYAAMLVLIVGCTYVSWLLFESNTYRVRKAIKRLLLAPAAPVVTKQS
jgi:peptidoglycan/LPS O-acetylase OafA/YrhL